MSDLERFDWFAAGVASGVALVGLVVQVAQALR